MVKGMTEDKMVGWHHRLDGHEFEQTGEMVKDREALHVALHGVAKNRVQLSDFTLPLKVHLVKAMVFPLVMYGWM